MPTPLEWLATAPWPSVPELGGFMYVDRSTISRQMPDWREYSLVVTVQTWGEVSS